MCSSSTVNQQYCAQPGWTPLLLAGHVTKEGSIAGPRVLEHMVDVVLYLEGERISSLRLLRCEKNRFGSTQEVGVFEMHSSGLIEVQEPSSVLLKERLENVSGSAITCTLEGTRPLILEVQALVTPSTFTSPRRLANGITFNRLLLVTAVLSKNSRLSLGAQDIVLNIAGLLAAATMASTYFLSPQTHQIYVSLFVILLGVSTLSYHGVWTVTVGELAGTANTGTALGAVNMFMRIGMIMFPPIFGLLVDNFGSYPLAWSTTALVGLLATIAMATIGVTFKRTASE